MGVNSFRRTVAFSVLLVAGIGCTEAANEEVELTSISAILEGRVDDGADVTIQGAVTEVRPLPIAERESFELSSEAGGRINVITDDAAPAVGQRFQVSGRVRRDFRIRDVSFGTVVVERSRTSVGSAESEGIPVWVWFAAGGAGLLLILVLVLARLFRPRAEEAMTCPHCGAPAESDWVVCTECGGVLAEEPAKPETIISAPPEPPGPSDEEMSETRRRSAPTVIIPPDEGEDEH